MTSTSTQPRSLPPGNLGLPLIGETISFLRDPDFMEKRRAKYGPVFKTHIFGRPTVIMSGPEAVRFLLTGENRYVTINLPGSTQALLGQPSLSTQEGADHHKRRKLMMQAFTAKALAGYLPTMEQITQRYLQKWQQMETLTWYPELRAYTFDVACTLFMGTELGSQTHLGETFQIWCDGLFTVPISLPWTQFGRAVKARKELLTHIEQIVRQRQQAAELGQDALGLLLQARDDDGNQLSLEELKNQVLLLLFAGHETLTSAIASLCLLLAQHPNIVEQVRQEQATLAIDGPLTMEKLKQMSYLDTVLKEVLRFISPVGGGFRRFTQSCEFNGYAIPEGWNAIYQIAETHKDGCVYSQPEAFDPERFCPARAEDRQQAYSYIPFGGGPRECLGLSYALLLMKVFAVHLAQGYQWELLPGQNLDLNMIPTPRPKDGLKVRFQARVDR